MKLIKILIADDEYFAREVIKTYLKEKESQHTLQIEEATSGAEALDKIVELKPDLLFLDVQMPELTGMDVLREINPLGYRPAIIFTTAFEQYALKAFEVKAIDYLLKPFDQSRFNDAFSKALEYTESKNNDVNQLVKKLQDSYEQLQQTNKADHLTRILVKEPKRMFFVKTNEVYWFEASGDYVVLHLEKKSHLISQSLNQLEAHLNSGEFVRIHRSYIVNVNYITEFEPHFNSEYYITLKNGARLKLSRTYRNRLGFLFADIFNDSPE